MHCPHCQHRAMIHDKAAEGVHIYTCLRCDRTVETTEVPTPLLRELLAASLELRRLKCPST
jgi:DNA-directed RNA polymerase subunit RPC12/RpoP